jgi:hypothetical protein
MISSVNNEVLWPHGVSKAEAALWIMG